MFIKRANASAPAEGKKSLKTVLGRAFTITELVIVIAVIAILAAVLIPTFTSLINRANESADIQTVKNLNTILSSEEALGNRADNIEEALEQALNGGYKVENLTPTSDGNDIVWDATNNRFALVDGDGNKVFGDALTPDIIKGQTFWKITDDKNKASDTNFSWYLTQGALTSDGGTTETMEITSSANLNLSAFTDLKTVTISTTEADAVVNLTTNSEDVKISVGTDTTANTATVNLYGTAGTVGFVNADGSITGGQFGMDSLHVYGKVEAIYYGNGHVVIENGAEVNYIVATLAVQNNPDKFKVEVKNGGKLNYLASSNEYTYMNVGAILFDENEPSLTTVISYTNIPSLEKDIHAGGIGQKNAPYLLSNGASFTHIHGGQYIAHIETTYFKLTNDITLETSFAPANPLSKMVLDLAGHTITLKAKQTDLLLSAFIVQKGSHLTIEDSVGGGGIVTPNTYATDGTVGYIFAVLKDSSLTINGGTFVGGMTVVQTQSNASAVINGGTYSTLVSSNEIYFVLNRLDKTDDDTITETAIASLIVVNGGEFKNFNPAAPETDPDENGAAVSYLGSGCKSELTEKDGATWWVVTK